MKILLDTHVFLWYLTDDVRLPVSFLSAILNRQNEVYLSVASIWETVSKYRLGKLTLPTPPQVFFPIERAAHGISSLAIDEGTMMHLAELPPIHRDPFDRILIAQALQHGLSFATVDAEIAAYSLTLLPRA